MKKHVLGTKDHAQFLQSAGVTVRTKKVAHA
jgi:hypothetical protein